MARSWWGYIRDIDTTNINKLDENSSSEQWFDVLDGFQNPKSFNEYSYIYRTDESLGTSKTAFIHLMAKLKAPDDVINFYRENKYFFSLLDEDGKMAIDYLDNCDEDYKNLYRPEYKIQNVDFEKLKKIEEQFHAVIMHRAKALVLEHKLLLPDLRCYVEKNAPNEIYFAVPGMYGGFSTTFEFNSDKSDIDALISSSWCRVAGGSGEEHRCTPDEWKLTRIEHMHMETEWWGLIKDIDVTKIKNLDTNSSSEQWFDALDSFQNPKSFNEYSYIYRTDESLGTSKTAFIHLMAKLKAPSDVINFYRENKYFFSLLDEDGKMAIDYLDNCDEDYKNLYRPEYKIQNVDFEKLKKIEEQFHAVIMHRLQDLGIQSTIALVGEHKFVLPDLRCYIEKYTSREIYFAVPGMYGGFSTKFEFNTDKSDIDALISSSWSRIIDGSGEEHRCTPDEWTLTSAGYI